MIADCMVLAPTDQSLLVRELVRVIGDTRDGRIALFSLTRKKNREFSAPYFVNASALRGEIKAGLVLANQQFEVDWMPTSFAEVPKFYTDGKGTRVDNPTYVRLRENMRIMAPLIGGDALEAVVGQGEAAATATRPFTVASEASLLDPVERAILVRALSGTSGRSERQIGRWLHLWWFGGKTCLALVPCFPKCGPRGQRQSSKQKKRGARRTVRITNTEHLRGAEVAVTPELRAKILKHAAEHWRPGNGLIKCHNLYIATYHNKGWVAKHDRLEAVIDYAMPQPSLKQYRYVAESANDNGELERLAIGERKFREKIRILVKTGRGGVRGPAHIFQIDWTGIQLNVRSIFNKNVSVGRAIVYFVVDVWSTAIVGFYLVLAQNPTFAIARRALLHAFSDKVAACAEHGVQIESDDWFAFHLCHVLVADNGEIAGDISDALPEELRTREWFTRGKTPTDHGLVERINGTLKAGPLGAIPGAWKKNDSFREEDLRHASVTSIPAIRKLIIYGILEHNRNPVPEDFVPPEYIEAGYTDISRNRLHKWGLENLNSLARTCDPKIVYSSLLSPGVAEVRRDGIHFKYNGRSHRFVDESPLVVSHLLLAARKGNFQIDVRFDEMAGHRILIKDAVSRTWLAVPSADKDVVRQQASFKEVALLMKTRSELDDATRAQNRAHQVSMHEASKELTRHEAEVSALADDGSSKTKRKRTNKRLREVEARLHRESENIVLDRQLGQQLELLPEASGAPTGGSIPALPTLKDLRSLKAARIRELSAEQLKGRA